ncbi:MAG: mechanosensitive ion channel [Bacteroidota bacterium]
MKEIDKLSTKADLLVNWLSTSGIDFGMKLLGAITVLIIGTWVIRIISKRVMNLMAKSNVEAALQTFIKSILTVTLRIILIISALSMIGIQMTTFIAMLSAASLAVALAFRNSLSNLAGGVMIMFFKPFKMGDFITAQGHAGSVNEIQIFNTYLTTSDNKIVIIPNGKLSNGVLVNNSTKDTRRVDWVFGIGYGDNYDTAKNMILEFLTTDKRVINTPAEPFIALQELADSSVNIVVRAWVKKADYSGVSFGLNEYYYKNAAKNNINMPFPQMDIHMDKISA